MDAENSDRMDVDVGQGHSGTTSNNASSSDGGSATVSSGTTPVSLAASSDAAADGSSVSTQVDQDAQPLPSIDEQVEWVMRQVTGMQKNEGLAGYLISTTWLSRVTSRSPKYSKEMGPFEKGVDEGEIGPIDNSSIVDPDRYPEPLKDEKGKDYVPIRLDASMDEDFTAVPEEAWKQIVEWYGLASGQKPIVRYLHNTKDRFADIDNFMWELHPPVFVLRRVDDETTSLDKKAAERSQKAPLLLISRSTKYVIFLKKAKSALRIPMHTKVTVHRVLETQPVASIESQPQNASMLSPPNSREASPAATPLPAGVPVSIPSKEFKELSESSQTENLELEDGTANEKYNGSITVNEAGLLADQTLIFDERISRQKGLGRTQNGKPGLKKLAGKDSVSATSSRNNSPAPESRYNTRGRGRNGRQAGTVGLNNLGNTCYMNSALQCIRSCQELSMYFLGK